MADLNKMIEQAIAKGISQRLTGSLESFVRNEILHQLKQYGIQPMKNSRRSVKDISLAEGRDIRRKIGTLVMNRVKNGVTEGLRFKLEGIKPRHSSDTINMDELQRAIKKAIQTKFKGRF